MSCKPADSQTKFNDVTSTHVPDAPDLHILDEALTDVDGDGDLDVAAAVEFGVNRLYINDGNGRLSWKKGVFKDEGHDTEHVRAADFNDDGNIDLLFVAEDDQTHEYYLGNGDGDFKNVSDRLPAMSEGNALAVGDLNGDGLPDAVVGNTGEEPGNFLWLNDPERPGHFIDASDTHLPGLDDHTQGLRLADLDEDGDLDMVVANEVPPSRLYLNEGDGRFTDHSGKMELKVPMHSRQAHVRDFTGDGLLDILFFNLTSNNDGWEKDPQIRLLVNNGKGEYVDESAERLPHNTFSAYAGKPMDINRDGAMDLIVGPIQIPGFIPLRYRAYLNNGEGYFRDETEDYIPKESKGRGWDMSVGDLNGDGLNDLFVGGWGTQARLLIMRDED